MNTTECPWAMAPIFSFQTQCDDDDLGFKGARTTMVIGAHNMTLKGDYVKNIRKTMWRGEKWVIKLTREKYTL